MEDGSMADSAPNTGTQTGNALSEETVSNTGDELLHAPIPTTPQSKPSETVSLNDSFELLCISLSVNYVTLNK